MRLLTEPTFELVPPEQRAPGSSARKWQPLQAIAWPQPIGQSAPLLETGFWKIYDVMATSYDRKTEIYTLIYSHAERR